MTKLFDPMSASTQHGTNCAGYSVVLGPGMDHLALRISGVMHRHRRCLGRHYHPRMRDAQHEKQREHKAQTQQQAA
ncbi:MAG: hypothetical protein ABI832_14350 [bacterium]